MEKRKRQLLAMGAGEPASGTGLERFPELGSQGRSTLEMQIRWAQGEDEDRVRGPYGKGRLEKVPGLVHGNSTCSSFSGKQ